MTASDTPRRRPHHHRAAGPRVPDRHRPAEEAQRLLAQDADRAGGGLHGLRARRRAPGSDVLFAHGANFTAGLELDKVAPLMRERGSVYPVGSVDPLSLRPPIRTKPLVVRRAGHLLHARHRADAGGRHRRRRRRLPLRPDRGEARHHAGRRRHHPHGGAGRLGQRPALPADRRRVRRGRGAAARASCRRWCRRGSRRSARCEIARTIAEQAPLAVRASLPPRASRWTRGRTRRSASSMPMQARLMATEDAAEGVRSFVERRAGKFAGR